MQLFLASGSTLRYLFSATIILYLFLYMKLGGLSQEYFIQQGLTGDLRIRLLLVGLLGVDCLWGMLFFTFTYKDTFWLTW